MGTIRVFCNGAGQIAANDSDGCAPVWRFIQLGAQARNANEKADVLRLQQRRATLVVTRPVTAVLCSGTVHQGLLELHQNREVGVAAGGTSEPQGLSL